MDIKEAKKPFNLSKLFRNIWLLSLVSAFSYFVYIVLKDVDKKMTESEALNLVVVLLIIGIIGGLAFIIWLFLKFSKRLKRFLIISFLVVSIPLIVIQIVRTYLYEYPEIAGKSMTGFQDGKRYLVCKFCRDYERGEVVSYKNQRNPDLNFIGRIIGLPNETIQIERGSIAINGNILQENYADWSEWQDNQVISLELKSDEYFILYDKRIRSDNTDEQNPIELNKIKKENINGKFVQ